MTSTGWTRPPAAVHRAGPPELSVAMRQMTALAESGKGGRRP